MRSLMERLHVIVPCPNCLWLSRELLMPSKALRDICMQLGQGYTQPWEEGLVWLADASQRARLEVPHQ